MTTITETRGELLALAVELGERIGGRTNNRYVQVVLDRLALGAMRYGESAYLRRDNLRELAEETPDVAAYALLELDRLSRLVNDEDYQSLRMVALKVAALGAVCDLAAREFQSLRDEILPT